MAAVGEDSRRTKTRFSKPRVRFDEEGIAVDMEERGKVYGTMRIDQVETPFIYYDEAEEPLVSQYRPNDVPAKMQATELQAALGILLEQQKGNCGGVQEQRYEKVDRRMEFIANRDKLYNQEAACLSKFIEDSDLPVGWSAVKSNTFPGECYFFNHESGESTWELPVN